MSYKNMHAQVKVLFHNLKILCLHAQTHSLFPTDFAVSWLHCTGDQMTLCAHKPLILSGPMNTMTVGQMGPWRQCKHLWCMRACVHTCMHEHWIGGPHLCPPFPPKVPELISSRSTPYLYNLTSIRVHYDKNLSRSQEPCHWSAAQRRWQVLLLQI